MHIISTGLYKGTGTEGASISGEDLSYIRARVESLNEHFQTSIRRGRNWKNLTQHQFEQMSDGRVHIAAQAKAMGFIDAIMSFEQALEEANNLAIDEKNTYNSVLTGPQEVQRKSLKSYTRSLDAFRQRQGV